MCSQLAQKEDYLWVQEYTDRGDPPWFDPIINSMRLGQLLLIVGTQDPERVESREKGRSFIQELFSTGFQLTVYHE
jgi:hypothetical protein